MKLSLLTQWYESLEDASLSEAEFSFPAILEWRQKYRIQNWAFKNWQNK